MPMSSQNKIGQIADEPCYPLKPIDNYRALMGSFMEIDFETTSRSRKSTCAVGVVRMDGDRITSRDAWPVTGSAFSYSYLRGLAWRDEQYAAPHLVGCQRLLVYRSVRTRRARVAHSRQGET